MRWVFYLPYNAWWVFLMGFYLALRSTVTMNHRGQLPGDDDYEYRLEYVAAYVTRIRRRALAWVLIVTTLVIAYVYIDAIYLHWHGLTVEFTAPTLSETTALARAALPQSELLAIYGNGNESEQCLPHARWFAYRNIETQTAIDWRALVSKSAAYLTANRGREHCVCAPMFGVDYNHLAWEAASEEKEETRLVVVHLFNLHDVYFEKYDTLDVHTADLPANESMLGALVVVRQSQAHLFAWPPTDPSATVDILRRRKIRLRAMTWTGTMTQFDVEDEQAYCVAECYDLFSGVSVYERSRRQLAARIKVQ